MQITFNADQETLSVKFYKKYGQAVTYHRLDAEDLEILLRRHVQIDGLSAFLEVNDEVLTQSVPEDWPDSQIQEEEDVARQVTFREYTWHHASESDGKTNLFLGHVNPPLSLTRPQETDSEELYRWLSAFRVDAVTEPVPGRYLFRQYTLTEYKLKVFQECQSDYEAFLVEQYSLQRQADFHLRAIAALALGQGLPAEVTSVLNWIRQGPLAELEAKKTALQACSTKSECNDVTWNFYLGFFPL